MAKVDFTEVVLVKVSNHYVGQRLDNFLIRHLKNIPKSRIYNLIRKGEVRINKGRSQPDYKLLLDDIIRIPPVRMNKTEKVTKATAKATEEDDDDDEDYGG